MIETITLDVFKTAGHASRWKKCIDQATIMFEMYHVCIATIHADVVFDGLTQHVTLRNNDQLYTL